MADIFNMELRMQYSTCSAFIIFEILKLINGNSLPSNMKILDMYMEYMTCIDFDTLNLLKNLEEINVYAVNMSYFPDKDCSNPVHEEDIRPLDLPNLRVIRLTGIGLLKAPNTSLMPILESFTVAMNAIQEIHGTPFGNNSHLKVIGFYQSNLTAAPDITGGCNNLDKLNLNGNDIITIPENYFKGCSIKKPSIMGNYLTSFPNHAPLGNSVVQIKVNGNQISGMITDDMVKDLSKLTKFSIQNNKLHGFDASFCHGNKPVTINVYMNTDLQIFENPYRFCIHRLDTFVTKPKMDLRSTKIPCDHHRCWMKKYATKFNLQVDNCPDGRAWTTVTEMDVCGQG